MLTLVRASGLALPFHGRIARRARSRWWPRSDRACRAVKGNQGDGSRNGWCGSTSRLAGCLLTKSALWIPVSAPSAKASRSNGPRPSPGTAVQKEEWDFETFARILTHVRVNGCVDSCVDSVSPAAHEDQNASADHGRLWAFSFSLNASGNRSNFSMGLKCNPFLHTGLYCILYF